MPKAWRTGGAAGVPGLPRALLLGRDLAGRCLRRLGTRLHLEPPVVPGVPVVLHARVRALLPLLQRLPNPLRAAARQWLLLVPAMPLIACTLLLQPHFEDTGDLVHDWFRHARVLHRVPVRLVAGDECAVWAELARLRRVALDERGRAVRGVCGLRVPAARRRVRSGCRPSIWVLRNLYIWWMLCAILGYARTYLDRPFRWLPWANEAVYPWYVLHQSLIVAIAYRLCRCSWGPSSNPRSCSRHRRRLRVAARDHSPQCRCCGPLFGLKRRQASAASISFARDSGVSVGA